MVPGYLWSQIHCKSTLIAPHHLCSLYPCTLSQMNKGESAFSLQQYQKSSSWTGRPPDEPKYKPSFIVSVHLVQGEGLLFSCPQLSTWCLREPRSYHAPHDWQAQALFHARLTFLKGNFCSRRRNLILTAGSLHLLFPMSDPGGHLLLSSSDLHLNVIFLILHYLFQVVLFFS